MTDTELTFPFTSGSTLADGIMYVSGSGSDSNSGLSRGAAKRTLASAYASLPSTGGTIFAYPGRYDVGSGFALTRGKPVSLIGLVRPPSFIASTTLVPLNYACAIVYSSTNPASLITTIAGVASDRMSGCKIDSILFELSGTNTQQAIDADTCVYWEVANNYFYADKITGPSPVTARAIWCHYTGSYSDNDTSWWRVYNNRSNNMALATFGALNAGNNNQQLIYGNVCLGLDYTNTSCLPALTLYSGHRCSVRDNNLETYNVAIMLDHCTLCSVDADGGEFVKYFVDMYSSGGNKVAPLGISWSAAPTAPNPPTPHIAGSRLIRCDTFCPWNIFTLPNVGTSTDQYYGLFRPTDDATEPAIDLGGSIENTVIGSRYSTNPMQLGGTSTTTPGAVATVNIAHGLGTTPVKFDVSPGNTNARGAPVYSRTADATNIILSFSANLTAATSYAWNWWAHAR